MLNCKLLWLVVQPNLLNKIKINFLMIHSLTQHIYLLMALKARKYDCGKVCND